MYNIMTTKRTIHFWLMAALMGGLSLGFAACSDDDDKPTEEQRVEQELSDAADFWNVVGQLTDDVLPDEGWQTATYAPSIGEADGTNSTVRIVQCADAENAAESFADLVGLTYGKEITADTPEYTYKSNLVGTLTYRRASGETLATVDVDIAQMPGLQQIVYRRVVENASFSGTAYYRFGDIVAKQNADGQTDYWICVRPAFGPAGKGDSHWVSLSKIPSANVKTVNKVVSGQKLTHVMPKSLSTNQEHMQNLAEMLYAMLFPDQWAKNLKDNDGYKKLKYFKDFDYKKLFVYNDNEYFRSVAAGWADHFVAIFGMMPDELRQELTANGLNLIYGTATMSGNNISLPMATFYQTNLKTKLLSKKTSTWDKQSFNIYDLTKKGYAEFTNASGGTERVWAIRYATGATLAKGSAENPVFDKYKRLPNCQDVYVYNRDVEANLNLNNLKDIAPRVATKTEKNYSGKSHYRWGDVYKDEEGCRWFVASMSGQSQYQLEEGSPYSELITFEGIKYTADKSRATNLPTREQAIRGIYLLDIDLFTGTTVRKYDTEAEWHIKGWYMYGSTLFNLRNYANFDPSTLLQRVWPQSNDPRQSTHAISVAYDDHASGNKQPLLRWLAINQNEKNDIYFYAWDSYPRVPSPTEMYPTDFSNVPIYLQDIANEDKVARYATDAYATQPLFFADGPIKDISKDHTGPRSARSETDSRANDVTNYFYNRNVWWNRTFATDMWNAPVAMFRITRVHDRGDEDYSTTTVDGHRLTLYHERQWGLDEVDDDIYEDHVRHGLQPVWLNFNTIHLNGKLIGMPSWKTAW